jgi:D-alanyl-D-alanine carboxypeptidase
LPDRAQADPLADAPACNEQRPLPFLVRSNYVSIPGAPLEVRRARLRLHAEAIRYRTERYGKVSGFGLPEWNAAPAVTFAEHATFMGKRVALNRRIMPAVRCAEREIRATCKEVYEPMYLSGFRSGNTFVGGEVSNHLFGIAIDVDPEHNVCCKCVGPAARHTVCARPDATLADRMAMPPCWVAAFERFGFYWLGRDEMEDTMHFEFLGDPDRILRAAP